MPSSKPVSISAFEELRVYFVGFLETHSASSVNIERCGLQFFYRYVLDQPWICDKIVKAPRLQRLPDVLTRAEMHGLLGSVRKLRYRVFFILTRHSRNQKCCHAGATANSLICTSLWLTFNELPCEVKC